MHQLNQIITLIFMRKLHEIFFPFIGAVKFYPNASIFYTSTFLGARDKLFACAPFKADLPTETYFQTRTKMIQRGYKKSPPPPQPPTNPFFWQNKGTINVGGTPPPLQNRLILQIWSKTCNDRT